MKYKIAICDDSDADRQYVLNMVRAWASLRDRRGGFTGCGGVDRSVMSIQTAGDGQSRLRSGWANVRKIGRSRWPQHESKLLIQ